MGVIKELSIVRITIDRFWKFKWHLKEDIIALKYAIGRKIISQNINALKSPLNYDKPFFILWATVFSIINLSSSSFSSFIFPTKIIHLIITTAEKGTSFLPYYKMFLMLFCAIVCGLLYICALGEHSMALFEMCELKFSFCMKFHIKMMKIENSLVVPNKLGAL